MFLVLLIIILFSSSVFAAIGNVCENIHVNESMQTKYFGGTFGQEVCVSGFTPNTYFVNYRNGSWTWVLHQCVKPIEENNLFRFYFCGSLK